MQVKSIPAVATAGAGVEQVPAPVEALVSPFGGAGFFLADDADVASYASGVDCIRETPDRESSVWVAVPFARDVLVAACMAADGTTTGEVAAMTGAQLRSWALGELLHLGTAAVLRERETDAFAAGYRHDADEAVFFALVVRRIDAVFGFGADPGAVPARCPATRPTGPRPARAEAALTGSR